MDMIFTFVFYFIPGAISALFAGQKVAERLVKDRRYPGCITIGTVLMALGLFFASTVPGINCGIAAIALIVWHDKHKFAIEALMDKSLCGMLRKN